MPIARQFCQAQRGLQGVGNVMVPGVDGLVIGMLPGTQFVKRGHEAVDVFDFRGAEQVVTEFPTNGSDFPALRR